MSMGKAIAIAGIWAGVGALGIGGVNAFVILIAVIVAGIVTGIIVDKD